MIGRMASLVRIMGVRGPRLGLIALGLIALGLSACASNPSPAPISYLHAHILPPSAAVRPAPLPIDRGLLAYETASEPVILANQPPSECVPFARSESGVQIFGDAVTWWVQADGRYARSGHPAEGAVLVLRGWSDDARGHVAVVRAIDSDRMIRVDHANWMHGGEISLNVPVADVSPDNDWSQVRVWNISAGDWGGRVYQTQGFIHPYGGLIPPPGGPVTGNALLG
jgi:hypothetical protein